MDEELKEEIEDCLQLFHNLEIRVMENGGNWSNDSLRTLLMGDLRITKILKKLMESQNNHTL